MRKGYQGDELWSAVNPINGKRELATLETASPDDKKATGQIIPWLFH
jgi:hypothetical protein